MRVFNGLKLVLLLIAISWSAFAKAEDEAVTETPESDNEEADDEEGGIEEEEGVLVLTQDNFREGALSADIILVEFYAPWCGHCKNLAPEYAKAAQKLKEHDPPIPLAKVDATEHKGLASEYGVQGYPTLKVFRKGLAYDYEGPRNEDGIVKYMEEQADPNWKPPPEKVVTLTGDNFDEFVNTHPLVLLEFYAPWCGHCKKLAPELEKAAGDLEVEDPPIIIAKVDATVETELATRFQVTGYPTMFVMRYGVKYEYDGPRERVGIAKYMRKKALPTATELTTMKEVKDYIDYLDDLSIVGFFTGEDDPMYQLYVDTANAISEEYRFGYTFLEEARKQYDAPASSIVMFHSKRYHSKYEPTRYVFDQADATEDDLKAFYNKHNRPLVGHYTQQNKDTRYKDTTNVLVFYTVDWSHDYRKDTEYWRQKVLEVAKEPEFKDFTFAIADEDEFAKFLQELGLGESGNEINVGLYDTEKKRYAMDPDEEFSVESLTEFLHDFKAGKLKKVVKSQPKPRDNKGPVRIVVGKTFEEEVLNTDKTVLLEVYAPWCGHCKKLEPIYKKLGKKYKGSEDVVVAKIDGTQNDLPIEFATSGFPTIFLVKGGDTENLLKFEGGERTVETLSAFIEENTTKSQTKDEL